MQLILRYLRRVYEKVCKPLVRAKKHLFCGVESNGKQKVL